jgi:ribosomal protein L37E
MSENNTVEYKVPVCERCKRKSIYFHNKGYTCKACGYKKIYTEGEVTV